MFLRNQQLDSIKKTRLKLLNLLRRLVKEGNTVVVIEHDVDLIAHADYIIEMGPGWWSKRRKKDF